MFFLRQKYVTKILNLINCVCVFWGGKGRERERETRISSIPDFQSHKKKNFHMRFSITPHPPQGTEPSSKVSYFRAKLVTNSWSRGFSVANSTFILLKRVPQTLFFFLVPKLIAIRENMHETYWNQGIGKFCKKPFFLGAGKPRITFFWPSITFFFVVWRCRFQKWRMCGFRVA